MSRLDEMEAHKKAASVREPGREIVAGGRQFRWNSRIACRTLEETAFILFQSKMVSLNEVGTFVWDRFKPGASMGDVVTSVVEEFDAGLPQVEEDVSRFIEMLVERELLQEDFISA